MLMDHEVQSAKAKELTDMGSCSVWETPHHKCDLSPNGELSSYSLSLHSTCDTLASLDSLDEDSDTTSNADTSTSITSADLEHLNALAQELNGGCSGDELNEAEMFHIYSRQATVDAQLQLGYELERAHDEIEVLRAQLAEGNCVGVKGSEAQCASAEEAQQSSPALYDLFSQCETLLMQNGALKQQVQILTEQKDKLAPSTQSLKIRSTMSQHAINVSIAEKVAVEAEIEALTASHDALHGDYHALLKEHEDLHQDHGKICSETEPLRQAVQFKMRMGRQITSSGMSFDSTQSDQHQMTVRCDNILWHDPLLEMLGNQLY
jgi:hypothetical protein